MNEEIKVLSNDYIPKLVTFKIDQQKELAKDIMIEELKLLEDSERSFLNKHLNNDLTIYGYFYGDELAAVCGLQIYESSPGIRSINGLMAYICNVYTVPKYRKIGYQNKLLDNCLKIVNEKEIRLIFLLASNPIALKLYKKHGFASNEMMLIKYN